MFGLLLLAGIGWYWSDAMRALESARNAARRRCQELGLSLLDDTVVLARLRLRRDEDARLALWREYRFEFTGDGSSRHGGEIVLIGGRVLDLQMEPWREAG
jgi:hypothetical protein